jgi:hypothetical protein
VATSSPGVIRISVNYLVTDLSATLTYVLTNIRKKVCSTHFVTEVIVT